MTDLSLLQLHGFLHFQRLALARRQASELLPSTGLPFSACCNIPEVDIEADRKGLQEAKRATLVEDEG